MSSPVVRDDGIFRPLLVCHGCIVSLTPSEEGVSPKMLAVNRALLTVPLLCWPRRPRLQVEGADQVQRGCPQVEMVQSRPQVDHVTLLAAPRVEAAEHVALKVDAERAPAATPRVDRAGTPAWGPAAAHPPQHPQVPQPPLQRQLPLGGGKAQVPPLAGRPRR